MSLSEAPVPEGVQRHISFGRYREAAKALSTLAARRPSAPLLLALAAVDLQLGNLHAARQSVLRVVEADPQRPGARFLLGRIRAALDEHDAALADFGAALDQYFGEPATTARPPGPIPVHYALHNLEQLAHIEEARGLPAGTLLPVTGARRDEMRRQLGQMLDKAGVVVPGTAIDGELGRVLAHPPRLLHDEPPPPTCLGDRNDWHITAQSFAENGGMACVDGLLTPEALSRLQHFMLLSTVWRQPNRHGYVGGLAEHGFFSSLLLRIASELKQALPELLKDHHLLYWWGFVYQHQRPGTDIHADQSDISLNLWTTPDSANLEPGTGGLDFWDVAAPADWTFAEYNAGAHRIRMFLDQSGARRKSFAYGENRALLFKGTLFHQTASSRFAEGFANKRRNITMLFRRTRTD
jgi:hypothetical protein